MNYYISCCKSSSHILSTPTVPSKAGFITNIENCIKLLSNFLLKIFTYNGKQGNLIKTQIDI